jgi:phospho-N-acetylmuramoyl-pentapeptide-transferase
MLYYLFTYLQGIDFPGAGVFQYITFRAAFALIGSLIISMIIGKRIIQKLQLMQVGEIVRDLGLQGQIEKQGTPTMGGLIILAAILIPTLLFAKLDNIYIILMIISTILLGLIGFIDDYIKVFKKNKEGLAGRFKIMGQVVVGIIVGSILYFNEGVVVKQKTFNDAAPTHVSRELVNDEIKVSTANYTWEKVKSTVTTIPFVKNNEFNYSSLTSWAGKYSYLLGGIVFILIVIVIITAVSNGANMTDGLDGLATGTSAIIGITLAVFAYVSGNTGFAD